ncbi:putative cation transporter HKT7 [Iris pallida]|uniref:Cation transporter HKT7 n=1 Tax=Iris pallida TaxID=29817 RepID=A0AAX6EZ70_IRIPA|nr:putative cation transporter HKT7 [Iris pallida]
MAMAMPFLTKSIFHKLQIRFLSLRKALHLQASWSYRLILSYVHPLFFHIIYFLSTSFIGFLLLERIPVRNPANNKPGAIDIFFTSVSAATVSSMSTVEMEVFSNPQLIVLTVLMLIGGEVFTSALGLLFKKAQLKRRLMAHVEPTSSANVPIEPSNTDHHIVVFRTASFLSKELKYNSTRQLAYVLIAYLVVLHVAGSISVVLYMRTVSSAREVLREKEISISTFSVFTTVSSFSSCGFIPTNENMIVFKKNTGLLWLVIPQVLLGNTLFPSCLRLVVWILKRSTKRVEFDYLLQSSENIGYYHFLPHRHSVLLALTVVGFLVVQLVLVCSMEWHSEAFAGLTSYQKLMGALFMSVNSRHTGESTVNLSQLSSAILVLFVLMMYLPPYTSFLPVQDERRNSSTASNDKKSVGLIRSLLMSQLSYLTISVILICITERRKLSEDPLNFNVLNIVVEVIRQESFHLSNAYGNVGFSTGYSCDLQLRPNGNCKDTWYGFVGRWSAKGKVILIFVMFFGRLKKFSMDGGKAWKLG